jgi:hypothetical protein
MKTVLKPPGSMLLKLRYDEPLSNAAFKFTLRLYTTEWVSAERVAADTAEQIANHALARLGEVLVTMPVDVPGRARLTLHIRHRNAEVGRRTFTPGSALNPEP